MFYLFAALLGGFAALRFAFGQCEICPAGSEKQRAAHHDVQQYFYTLDRWLILCRKGKALGDWLATKKNVKTVAIYGMGVWAVSLPRNSQKVLSQSLMPSTRLWQTICIPFPFIP